MLEEHLPLSRTRGWESDSDEGKASIGLSMYISQRDRENTLACTADNDGIAASKRLDIRGIPLYSYFFLLNKSSAYHTMSQKNYRCKSQNMDREYF